MKIAVTSVNGKNISGHAGACLNYLIFELNKDQTIRQKKVRLDETETLDKLYTNFSTNPNHPLSGVDTLVAENIEDRLLNQLSRQGINVFKTHVKEPLEFINRLEISLK